MNQYVKKIRKNIYLHGIFLGLGWGALLATVVLGVQYLARLTMFYNVGIRIGLYLIAGGALLGLLLSISPSNRVKKRVTSLERMTTKTLDDDHFQELGKELALGDEWLVYHRGLDYRFWTKDTMGIATKLSGNNLEITDKNGRERSRIRVKSSLDLEDVLNDWANPKTMATEPFIEGLE